MIDLRQSVKHNKKAEDFEMFSYLKKNRGKGLLLKSDKRKENVIYDMKDDHFKTAYKAIKCHTIEILEYENGNDNYMIYMDENALNKNLRLNDYLKPLDLRIYGDVLIVFDTECLNCGKYLTKLKCGKCKKARYCNRECQLENWECHKGDCL